MPELNEQARHAVSLAFGIPQTMLEDAANFATSQEHRLSFWQDTVVPRGEWIAEQFNRQLLKDFKIKMAFGFEELEIFQTDENERGDSLNKIVTAINLNAEAASWAMSVLGYDLTEEQEAELNTMIKKKEEEKEQMLEAAAASPAPPANQPKPKQPPAKAAWSDDLARWERKALRVIKESQSAICTFESDLIPSDMREQVDAGLPGCKSADEVKALFDGFNVESTEQAPAPEYKSNPAAIELAKSINGLAEVYLKSLIATPAPAPNINVTLPPITMTAHLPEMKEPSITFSPTIEAKAAEQAAPQVVINIPESPAPVVQNTVNVDVPEQAMPEIRNEITVQPADVNIEVPKPKRERQTVKRNKQTGFIESTDTKIEYEE
jgi:hypothetical protein